VSAVRVGIMQAAGVFSVCIDSDDPAAADAAYEALERAGLKWPLHATFQTKACAKSARKFVLASMRKDRAVSDKEDPMTEARRFSRQTRFIIAGGATARPVHELDAVDRVCDELEALRADAAALTARAEQAEQERDALRASARVVLDVWSALGDGSVSQRKFDAALDAMREAST